MEQEQVTQEVQETQTESIDQTQYLDGIGFEQEQTVETGTQEQPQEAQEEQAEPTAEAEKPAQAQETPDFMKQYFDENGNINLDNYVNSLSKASSTPEVKANLAKPGTQLPPQAQPEPEKSELEIRTEYRKNLETEKLTPFNRMIELVNQGFTVDQAFQAAQNEAMQGINKSADEWLLERQTNADQERLKAHQDQIESAQLQPRSETNHARLAQEYGFKTVESFKNALFHPKYGGADIQYLFAQTNPDYSTKYSSEQALQEAYNSWYTKFSANDSNLRWLAEQTKMRSASELWPTAIKQLRGGVQAQEKRKMQSTMASPNQKNLSPAVQKSDSFDSYMNSNDPSVRYSEI